MIPILIGVLLALFWWLLLANTCGFAALTKSVASSAGHLLEIGLYKDSPKAIWASLWDLCKASYHIGRHLLIPCVLFSVVCLPVLGAMADSQRFRPVRPNESILVSVVSQQGSPTVQLPEGVTLETKPTGIVKGKETYWRVRAQRAGNYRIIFVQENQENSKTLTVSQEARFLSSERSQNWLAWLLEPNEKKLPNDSPMSSIRVDYRRQDLWLSNIRVHWLLLYLIPFLLALAPTKKLYS